MELKVLEMKLFLTTQKHSMMNKIGWTRYHCSERTAREAEMVVVAQKDTNFRHLPKNAFVQLLRVSRVPKEFIEAPKVYEVRCTYCH